MSSDIFKSKIFGNISNINLPTSTQLLTDILISNIASSSTTIKTETPNSALVSSKNSFSDRGWNTSSNDEAISSLETANTYTTTKTSLISFNQTFRAIYSSQAISSLSSMPSSNSQFQTS